VCATRCHAASESSFAAGAAALVAAPGAMATASAEAASAMCAAGGSPSQLLTSCARRCCSFFASPRPAARTRWMPSLRRAGVQFWPPFSMPRMIRSISVASASFDSGASPASWRNARS
jgi:hypothetical protein